MPFGDSGDAGLVGLACRWNAMSAYSRHWKLERGWCVTVTWSWVNAVRCIDVIEHLLEKLGGITKDGAGKCRYG